MPQSQPTAQLTADAAPPSLWTTAILMGLSTKALLHIRLFSINAGGQDVPIGIETLVHLFEPWLKREMLLSHFNAMRTYLRSRMPPFADLAKTRHAILANVPASLPDEEKKLLSAAINEATTALNAMDICLTFLGKKSVERAIADLASPTGDTSGNATQI